MDYDIIYCIQDRMQHEMDKGNSKSQAAAIITNEVGHERIEVIDIYLAGKEILPLAKIVKKQTADSEKKR